MAKRRVAGLPASRSFSAQFNIELATNTPTGCLTAFGPVPVAQAFAHASVAEPVPASDSSGLLRLDWTAPGSASLGPVTNGATCGSSDAGTWVRTTLSGTVGPSPCAGLEKRKIVGVAGNRSRPGGHFLQPQKIVLRRDQQ